MNAHFNDDIDLMFLYRALSNHSSECLSEYPYKYLYKFS